MASALPAVVALSAMTFDLTATASRWNWRSASSSRRSVTCKGEREMRRESKCRVKTISKEAVCLA